MTDTVECIVIGAGVVGLAVARELALRGVETIVLESEALIGSATSSRNSEVIHAGIYYPKDSLKATLCVKGKKLLYQYCQQHNVQHNRCGKLIVATSESQLEKLKAIQHKAFANGVQDLQLISKHDAMNMEPELRCSGALYSPSTGIIDSHGLMLNLQGDLETAGGMIAFGSPLISASCTDKGTVLSIGGQQGMVLKAKYVVNCGGLQAQHIAKRFEGLPPNSIPPIHYAKGNYYALTGKSPFSRLIYPVPERAGLGVHATIDLGNATRFGPDVEWVNSINYTVNPARADAFYAEIRKYWPKIIDRELVPAYSGIRPKLHAQGAEACDFMIQGQAKHGVKGLVNLYGIESPGLTASLAIAELVAELLVPM